MESPGEYLRRERELRGISLKKIHESTRVPMKSLSALEADRYEDLPHAAFVKGYIKAYCKELGLDETDAVLRYEVYCRERAEKSEPVEKPEKPLQREPVQIGSKNMVVILVGLGVLIIAVVYFVSSRGGPAVGPQGGPDDGPAQSIAAPESPAPEETTEEVPGAVKEPAVEAGGPASEKPALFAPLASPPLFAPPAPPPPPAPMPAAEPGEHVLTVTASETSWISITIDDGKQRDVLLRRGERAVWKASKSLSLVIGNAGGVKVDFDGKDVPLLGEPGEVVRIKLPL